MGFLRLEHIYQSFGGVGFIHDISLDVSRGEILCLLGPSGSGKTTLLRIISGIEQPDRGRVISQGRDITLLAPHLRNFGMMFQDFALFPHLDVYGNVAFGLELKGLRRDAIKTRVSEMLRLVGLKGFDRRNVSELSGGERQRVALARSIAPGPGLVMLDEPLGALDRSLRERLMIDLRNILKSMSLSAIFVTHDQSEAFAMADTVAVIHEGAIEQTDSPIDLYRRPKNAFVARFLGFHNLLEARQIKDNVTETPVGLLHMVMPGAGLHETRVILIRPDAARIITDLAQARADESVIRAVTRECLFRGKNYYIRVETDQGISLAFEVRADNPRPEVSRPVLLALDPGGMIIMPDYRT